MESLRNYAIRQTFSSSTSGTVVRCVIVGNDGAGKGKWRWRCGSGTTKLNFCVGPGPGQGSRAEEYESGTKFGTLRKATGTVGLTIEPRDEQITAMGFEMPITPRAKCVTRRRPSWVTLHNRHGQLGSTWCGATHWMRGNAGDDISKHLLIQPATDGHSKPNSAQPRTGTRHNLD
jgi:hypothetical protein